LADLSSQSEYIYRINSVIDFIDEHLEERINLEKLAEIACFSQFHFHRLFCSMLNETPLDYLNRVRLTKAANMLIASYDKSITQIALSVGFTSSAVFSRSFKNYFGLSPKDYRLNNSKICKQESNTGKNAFNLNHYFDNSNFSNYLNGVKMNVTIKTMPEFNVAYVANYEGYFVDKINRAWAKLCKWGESNDLINKDTAFLGISFDNPDVTPLEKCRYYACITIPNNLELPKGIGQLSLPAGKHAVLHFEGTDEDLQKYYKWLYTEWLPNSGYLPNDAPCYEIYFSTPEQNEQKIFILDICMPIKPLI